MPSYYYELITICFRLMLLTGKPPSMRQTAEALGVSYSTVVNRVKRMVELGYLYPFDRYSKRSWFSLTAMGASVYMECLRGDRLVFFDPSIGALSPSRHARHPRALYKQIPRREYTAQIESIALHGPSGATI